MRTDLWKDRPYIMLHGITTAVVAKNAVQSLHGVYFKEADKFLT